jgi:hypothetical protein
MNQYFRLPSGSARMAIGYITTGVLMMVWTGVWLHYLYNHEHSEGSQQGYYYICSGLMLSGFALLVIGVLMGRIGQEAKQADGVAPIAGAPDVVATIPQQVAPQQVAAPIQQMPVAAQPQQVITR